MDLDHSIFEYRHDNGHGTTRTGKLLLAGSTSYRDANTLAACLAAGREFVAEHVGIPALYDDAWALRADKDEDELDFHEFVGLRAAEIDEILDLRVFDEAGALLRRFVTASATWKQHEQLLEEA